MKEKIRFFFIISTILRSYLHYFILLEFSIKRHDVIQYMYHLNTLDLFHLFENMSTNIFFFSFGYLMTDWYTDFYHTYTISVILHTWATNRLEDNNCMYMCGHSDKRLDIESEYIQYVRFLKFLHDISHLYKKTGSVSPSTKKSNHYLYTKYSRKNPHWQTRSTFSLYKFKSSINSDDHSKRK